MSVSDNIIVLKKFPLFASFKKEHLQLIAFNLEKIHLQKGDILFHEKDVADCAFIVLSGNIELSSISADEKHNLGFVGPHQMLNETALIVENLVRKNTALATEKTYLLKLPQNTFKRFLSEFPEFVPILYQYYKSRLNKTEMLLTRFSDALQK